MINDGDLQARTLTHVNDDDGDSDASRELIRRMTYFSIFTCRIIMMVEHRRFSPGIITRGEAKCEGSRRNPLHDRDDLSKLNHPGFKFEDAGIAGFASFLARFPSMPPWQPLRGDDTKAIIILSMVTSGIKTGNRLMNPSSINIIVGLLVSVFSATGYALFG